MRNKIYLLNDFDYIEEFLKDDELCWELGKIIVQKNWRMPSLSADEIRKLAAIDNGSIIKGITDKPLYDLVICILRQCCEDGYYNGKRYFEVSEMPVYNPILLLSELKFYHFAITVLYENPETISNLLHNRNLFSSEISIEDLKEQGNRAFKAYRSAEAKIRKQINAFSDPEYIFEIVTKELKKLMELLPAGFAAAMRCAVFEDDLPIYKELGYGERWNTIPMPPIIPNLLRHFSKSERTTPDGKVAVSVYDLNDAMFLFYSRESANTFKKRYEIENCSILVKSNGLWLKEKAKKKNNIEGNQIKFAGTVLFGWFLFIRRQQMQIYILHGYVDGLTDPVVSTDYSTVYDAMKTAYEEAIDDAEQTPDELECSFLEGYSATAVVHGDWHEWQISIAELPSVALIKNERGEHE